MTKKKTSADMKDNILNYGSQIQSIEKFSQAVRKMPGMYIGRIGNPGFINMIREVYQNSIDELEKIDSPCDRIMVTYDERTLEFSSEDNGRAIPHGLIEKIFTSEHTSSNYTKKPFQYSSGLHGVGAKVTNALAAFFLVQSYIFGEGREMRFEKGIPVYKDEKKMPKHEGRQGTKITFAPDPEVMGEITVTCQDVLNLIWSIQLLTKLNTEILFIGIDKFGNKTETLLQNKNGIMDIITPYMKSPVTNMIRLFEDTGYLRADIAFTYDADAITEAEYVRSYSNMCPTTGGTHVDGLMDGLYRWFKTYMNKFYLANSKTKVVTTNADIRTGLKAVIHVAHLTPIFSGQAKDVLTNEDMKTFVEVLVCKGLDIWSKSNPKELEKICKYLKDVGDVRLKSDDNKIKLKTKYTSTSLSKGLPSKYCRPIDKKDLELIIVEGDSAGGGLKTNRDKKKQGLYPLKGKIPNAFTTPTAKFISNEEIAGLIQIIGCGWGKNFDISKLKIKRIIIATDADPDGAHIRSLLLKFFLRYMKPLVQAGIIHIATPPLYGAKIGNKTIYFADNIDYVAYVQKSFTRANKVCLSNGKAITAKQLEKLFNNNIDYIYHLKALSDTYSINMDLLEFILINRTLSFIQLKKKIQKEYRFMTASRVNNNVIVEGLVGSHYQTMFVELVLANAGNVLQFLDKAESLYFNLNGEKVSLFRLMDAFDKSSPSNITRYKGLGEMDPKELAKSTILPSDDRMLLQYTTEDIEAEINKLKYFETNRRELVSNTVASRQDLLG